jgi:hypothetical protein
MQLKSEWNAISALRQNVRANIENVGRKRSFCGGPTLHVICRAASVGGKVCFSNGKYPHSIGKRIKTCWKAIGISKAFQKGERRTYISCKPGLSLGLGVWLVRSLALLYGEGLGLLEAVKSKTHTHTQTVKSNDKTENNPNSIENFEKENLQKKV